MYTSIHHAFAFGSRFGEKRKKERERVANAKLRELEITPVSLRREAGRAAELRDVASLIVRDSVGQSLLWNVRDERFLARSEERRCLKRSLTSSCP